VSTGPDREDEDGPTAPEDAAPTPAAPAEPQGGTSDYWSDRVKNRWFFGALAFSTGALVVLFSPYLYVLLFAVVLVVVTWPIYEWVLRFVRGRRALASVLTVLLLCVVVFGPLASLIVVFVREALTFAKDVQDWVATGGFDRLMSEVQGHFLPSIEQRISDAFGWDFHLLDTVTGPVQKGLVSILGDVTSTLPTVINTTVNAGVDAVIFVFTTVTLYMDGPKALAVIKNLSPMDDRYEDQLFLVFRRFSNNMVVGSLVTGALQGLLAGVGYAIAGVDQVIFLAILTGVGSFIPVVGTTLIWGPVVIYVFAAKGWAWALFLGLWSGVLTASVDNFVKPLFLRGGSDTNPLLIFLGAFGGLAWMGVPGLLVGPVVVAFFLALYTIYTRDFLGLPSPLDHVPDSSDRPGLLGRLRARLLAAGDGSGAAEDDASAAESPPEDAPEDPVEAVPPARPPET